MSLIAIGFTAAGDGAPRGMFLPAAGGLRIAAVPAGAAMDRRARLRACLALFRECPSFLPLPVGAPVSVETAAVLARSAAPTLTARMEALRSCAEFVLVVSLTRRADDARVNGRAWLAGRHRQRSDETAAGLFLDRALERLAGPQDRRRSGLAASCLVPRQAVAAARDAVAGLLARDGGALPQDARVHATAPWPPFSFAKMEGCLA